MFAIRALQGAFARSHRFSQHYRSGSSVSTFAAVWLSPARTCHTGGTGGGAHHDAAAAHFRDCDQISLRSTAAGGSTTDMPKATALPRQTAAAAAAAVARRALADDPARKRAVAAFDEALRIAKIDTAAYADAVASVKIAQDALDRATVLRDRADDAVVAARAAAALRPNDVVREKALERCTAELNDRNVAREIAVAEFEKREAARGQLKAALNEATARLEKARAAAAMPFELPTEFSPVALDAAREQLGSLAHSKHFELPTATLAALERHVHALRALLGEKQSDKSAVPNLAVAATAGSGKTTLLRYLQQAADTVRYGAELQSDTNWLAKSWNAPSSADSDPPKPRIRHVFVGFATFNQGSSTRFGPTLDTLQVIESRCVWRILYDAGLAREWNSDFHLTFAEAAAALRAQISTAHGCMPEEVAVVFLIDEATKISNDDARKELLESIAGWQQEELAKGLPAVSIVAGLSLFAVGDQWITSSRRLLAALPLPPLAKVPHELATEVNDNERNGTLTRGEAWQLKARISAAGGHPRTLERIAKAIAQPGSMPAWNEPGTAEELACLWHVFASSVTASSTGFSANATELATAPEYSVHRSLLASNCLRQCSATVTGVDKFPEIALNVTPSALFVGAHYLWTRQAETSPGLPNQNAANVVGKLMRATGDIPKKWELGLAGGLHLTAQCILYARLNEEGLPPPSGRPHQWQALRGSVPFVDLVPGAIIGCQCDDLQYVVRGEFVHSVKRALTSADLQMSRDASCLHSESPTQEAIEYTFAAECGGAPVEVAAQHKFKKRATEGDINAWVNKVAEFMKPHMGDHFRVLLCVKGLLPQTIETIKKRAQDANDPLSRAIVIDTASASQFFDRLGVLMLVEALNDPRAAE